MLEKSDRKLTKRTIDALAITGKDAVFWDRDLVGFGVRVYSTGASAHRRQPNQDRWPVGNDSLFDRQSATLGNDVYNGRKPPRTSQTSLRSIADAQLNSFTLTRYRNCPLNTDVIASSIHP